MHKTCVLVDPYISASDICDALHAEDISPVAVLTDLPISEAEKLTRFPEKKFEAIYFYSDPDLPKKLSAHPILRIIAGSEASVAIADELSSIYCPHFANPTNTSSWRNNKFLMQEAIEKAHLNAVKQIKIMEPGLTKTQENLLANWSFPLIVKPSNSLCTFGFKKCEDLHSLQLAINELMGTTPIMGETINELVVQEYLQGTEYFVDTVSLNGSHKIIDVFCYHKTLHEGIPIYRSIDLVDPASTEATICIDYVLKVLDALELHHGLAHTELFLTEKGPFLVEINPRISGAYGYPNKLAAYILERDQATWVVKSIVNTQQFLKEPMLPQVRKGDGRIVCLQNWIPKKFNGLNIEKLKSFPSYHESIALKKIGETLPAAKYLTDTVAFVLLRHTDKKQVQDDYERILRLEENGQLF